MKEVSPPVSAMATPTNSNGNLVDEFEEAFQHCLNVLTKDEAIPSTDKDEIRVEVEQTTLRFVDLARQMEAFFLQKRFLLSALKPEMVIKEDINELRLELARKDELLKRHYEKVAVWQNLLADLQGYAKSPATSSSTNSAITNTATTGILGNNGSVVAGQSSPMVGVPIAGVGAAGPSGVGVAGGMVGGMVGAGATASMQHAQQLQQQQLRQMQQQQQMQQMQQMQVPPGMGPGGGVVPGMVSPQQAMFLQQQGMAGGRSPFGPQGPSVLQGPLAYLEKTTSNIDLVAGMTDGRR